MGLFAIYKFLTFLLCFSIFVTYAADHYFGKRGPAPVRGPSLCKALFLVHIFSLRHFLSNALQDLSN